MAERAAEWVKGRLLSVAFFMADARFRSLAARMWDV